MGSVSKFLKVLFRVVILLGVVQLVMVNASENGGRKMKSELNSINHMKMIRIEKHMVLAKLDLNYTNKRRVPNGPDPIHNRCPLSLSLSLCVRMM